MSDRRLTPANGRVAAMHLAGKVQADAYVEGWQKTVRVPVTDLCAAPDGPRDRQLLLGIAVAVFEEHAGFSFVQAMDGYVGYVPSDVLRKPHKTTHRVATFATHVYEAEDFKSRDLMSLSFGAQLDVTAERKKFFETPYGYVPKKHIRALDHPFSDPATAAQIHFDVPYLWGGNSTRGIDCSGLIAASLHACDVPCPADSDMQCEALGAPFEGDYQRGDLIFWKGHVGMMVDGETLIHATAHHMATRYENIDQAITRIEAQGDGPVIARKRL